VNAHDTHEPITPNYWLPKGCKFERRGSYVIATKDGKFVVGELRSNANGQAMEERVQ